MQSTAVEEPTRRPTTYSVAYIRGGVADDSGPEMADAAMAVLRHLLEVNGGPNIDWVEVEAGAHCYAEHGTALPADSLATILDLGIVFKAPTASGKVAAAEPIALTLRRELGAYASINELRSYPGVRTAIHPTANVLLVRDNSEALFAGQTVQPTDDATIDLRVITRAGAKRVANLGFNLARSRSKRVTICAFPAGIKSDQLFVRACEEEAEEFPDVTCWVRKVDAFAGTVVADAAQYDVVVTPNDWGAIMTDLIAAACGSVGLGARANLGVTTGYFEPIHGTAPGKAGKGTVNPVAQIVAGKLLLEWLGRTFNDESAARAADRLQRAITDVLATGEHLTADLGGTASTTDIRDAIIERCGSHPA